MTAVALLGAAHGFDYAVLSGPGERVVARRRISDQPLTAPGWRFESTITAWNALGAGLAGLPRVEAAS